MDERYVQVHGRPCYLYRAIDRTKMHEAVPLGTPREQLRTRFSAARELLGAA